VYFGIWSVYGYKLDIKINKEPGIVTHTCNSRYSRGRDWEDFGSRTVQAKKLPHRPPWWLMPAVSAMWEEQENCGLRLAWNKVRPYLKIKQKGLKACSSGRMTT
jgi:hypothetical protein